MNKLGRILSLTILMVLLSFSLCFASGLELLDSYPEDGGGGLKTENVMVKFFFNEDVSSKKVQDTNKNAFKFTDEKGKAHPIKVLYSEKKPKEIWVLVDETLVSDSSYMMEIAGDLQASNGDTLGKDIKVKFSTRNNSTDTTVNMALMGAMVVGMLVFSSISTKRNLKKQAESKGEVAKVNPYKVAKETGKAVEDIVAKTEKQKQKVKANASKNNKTSNKSGNQSTEAASSKDTKRVRDARPISSAGSTYITGRKAKAEKKAAEAAARAASTTTNPKKATGKSKNKKGKKK